MNSKIDASFPLGYDQRHRLRTTAAAANAVVVVTAAADTVVRVPVAKRPPGIIPITISGVAAPPSAVPDPAAVRDAAAAPPPVRAISRTEAADASPVDAPPPDRGGFGEIGGVRPVAVVIGPAHHRIVGTRHRHRRRRRRRDATTTTPLSIPR